MKRSIFVAILASAMFVTGSCARENTTSVSQQVGKTRVAGREYTGGSSKCSDCTGCTQETKCNDCTGCVKKTKNKCNDCRCSEGAKNGCSDSQVSPPPSECGAACANGGICDGNGRKQGKAVL